MPLRRAVRASSLLQLATCADALVPRAKRADNFFFFFFSGAQCAPLHFYSALSALILFSGALCAPPHFPNMLSALILCLWRVVRASTIFQRAKRADTFPGALCAPPHFQSERSALILPSGTLGALILFSGALYAPPKVSGALSR
jgi:hypothetical protein